MEDLAARDRRQTGETGTRGDGRQDVDREGPRVRRVLVWLQFDHDFGPTRQDFLRIDVEGLEDVILAPFFRDAPPRLWPRQVIIEDSRASWKIDLMSVMQGCGYELVALSRHKNLMLRLKP